MAKTNRIKCLSRSLEKAYKKSDKCKTRQAGKKEALA
jgi:hypothetical protein